VWEKETLKKVMKARSKRAKSSGSRSPKKVTPTMASAA
jgi:hypothetical protein